MHVCSCSMLGRSNAVSLGILQIGIEPQSSTSYLLCKRPCWFKKRTQNKQNKTKTKQNSVEILWAVLRCLWPHCHLRNVHARRGSPQPPVSSGCCRAREAWLVQVAQCTSCEREEEGRKGGRVNKNTSLTIKTQFASLSQWGDLTLNPDKCGSPVFIWSQLCCWN